jgi:suppressor for copper-sensitivity B
VLLKRAARAAASRTARAALVAVALVASAAGAQIARPQKAKLTLETHAERVAPGAELALDALVAIDAGWHVQAHVPTYDYLIPTELKLELPAGFAAPALVYPKPVRFKFAFAEDELDVYEGLVGIAVTLRVPRDAAPGPLSIAGALRYQACDDKSCLPPVDATARVEVQVVEASGSSVKATSKDEKLPLKGKTKDDEAAAIDAAERAVAETPDAPPAPAEAPAADRAAESPSAAVAPAPTPSGAPPTHEDAAPSPAPARSLAAILFLALLGGLILNGMPCVLPIVSLKLFGLVKSSGESRAAVRAGALATVAGIVVSFWALAAAAIAARSAGAAIGWGVQFQQPGFVAFLAVVILLFSLNLWGLFEIQLPARLSRLGESGAGEGLSGHFASGLFATLMATPCSAPFLGTALTFALGQSASVIFLTLTAVGVGLALPYLFVAVAPGAVRRLPKPGAWMETLRGAMGFLLAGALVWLLYVLAAQVAAEWVAFFEFALLALALGVWVASRRPLGSGARRRAWVVAFALALVAVALAARAPRAEARAASSNSADSIQWVRWDRAEAERLAASGRLVFLDVTADWCVTCKVNERVILDTPEVVGAFRRLEVVAMKADWTNRDDGIARFLAEHGRYGIPFYMLYRPGSAPHLFGELITKQEVVAELERSSRASG